MKPRERERELDLVRLAEDGRRMVQALAIPGDELGSVSSRQRAAAQYAMADPLARTLTQMVSTARKCEKSLAKVVKQQEDAEQAEMKEWQETTGRDTVRAVIEQLPQLAPFEHMMTCVPCGDTRVDFTGLVDQVKDFASLMMQVSQSKKSSSKLKEVIAADLDSKYGLISHDDVPPIVEDDADNGKKPPCNVIGFCLCSSHGVLVYAGRNAYLRHQKSHINTDALKDDVNWRRVFLCLDGSDPDATDNPMLRELNSLIGITSHDPQVFWLCIGAQSWSPYRASYKIYKEAAQRREVFHDDEIHLEAIELKIQLLSCESCQLLTTLIMFTSPPPPPPPLQGSLVATHGATRYLSKFVTTCVQAPRPLNNVWFRMHTRNKRHNHKQQIFRGTLPSLKPRIPKAPTHNLNHRNTTPA